MLQAVSSRRAAHNNAGSIARSAGGTALKLLYYRLLTAVYGFAGRTSPASLTCLPPCKPVSRLASLPAFFQCWHGGDSSRPLAGCAMLVRVPVTAVTAVVTVTLQPL